MKSLLVLSILMCSIEPIFARGGNGEGFNGGDPVHVQLLAVRSAIQTTFKWVKSDFATERLCNARFCSWRDASCDTIRVLTTEAANTCRDFITSSAEQYLKLFEKNPNKYFVVKAKELKDPVSRGNVAALTKSDPDAPIYFDTKKLSALGPAALFALLVHEYGHKIRYQDKLINDEEAPKGFQTGRQFLDTVGVALHQYSTETPAEREIAHLGMTQLYRSYDPSTDSHFYTISFIEHENVVKQGHKDESKSFPFFVFSHAIEGTTPIYRFVKKTGQYGFFPNKELSEADKEKGFIYDGVAFHVWKEPRANTHEIYRMTNSLSGASLFTVSPTELEAVKTSVYWKQSESLGYVPRN